MITSFRGQYRFLSNFWPTPVLAYGVEYPTVEHAYQACKTRSLKERAVIYACTTPGIAKRAGRKLTIRPDWNDIKLDIMRGLVIRKFEHPHLAALLLATGDEELVEGNTWGDRFWGQCPVGMGLNHLGIILMDVRRSLRS